MAGPLLPNFRFDFPAGPQYTADRLRIQRFLPLFGPGVLPVVGRRPVLRLPQVLRPAIAAVATRSLDTFPSPASFTVELSSGVRLAYPAGKGSAAIRLVVELACRIVLPLG